MSSEKIALFLGAGASKPLGMPTTKDFMEILRNWEHYKDLTEIVPIYLLSELDIEDVLYELNIIEKSKVIKHLFNDVQRICPEKKIKSLVEIIREMKKLREGIEKLIFRTYNFPREKISEAKKLYEPWFDACLKFSQGKSLSIFTLNYDGILREVARELEYRVIDGFHLTPSSKYRIFNPNVYKKIELEGAGAIVKIFCMHGELSWKLTRDGKIAMKSAVYELNSEDEKRAIIYPIRGGKYPYEEPFKTLYQFFSNELRIIERLLIIGYSFRDLPINSIINDSLLSNEKLKIIYVSPSATETMEEPPPNLTKDLIKDRFLLLDKRIEDYTSSQEIIGILK